ncbi:hypothetical protein [Sporichthya sp.]|uniref:hypothetical protein n=1 Tax=Sporichthya sp. TaxID=65475 RepID=UPI001851C1FA|nr:hypothetical protein [Sporichthya sp.]MBA3744316.1 hypothetical protein [Sporichthya sp.]
MGDNGHMSGRGTFSCRIEGRAGYLRVFDDRLEVVRSGRGSQALAPEVIPLHLVTAVTTGKVGRLLTAVELVAAGAYVELKLPSIDAPRVAELIAALAADALILTPDPSILALVAPMPVVVPLAAVAPVIPAQVCESVRSEPVFAEPVVFDPAPADSVMAGFVMPDFSMKVEMPEWKSLPETDFPELADTLSEIPAPPAGVVVPERSDEEPAAGPQTPVSLPPDLQRRLNRLEVLRNSGIMTDTDFEAAEAELFEAAGSAT